MARARTFIREMGGLERTRVFTRIWLALFGLWSWDDLPELPPEMIFLPRWFPLNVYDWACWARQTVVPLTIVGSLRPVRPLPIDIDELRTGASSARSAPLWTWTGFFQRTDRVLKLYGRHAIKPLRELAQRRGAEWILARQEADGSWGGIQPPWVYSLLALHLLGYPLDHPALKAGFAGLDAFTIREETEAGWVRRLEACQSPVWDTALALVALLDAGVPAGDEAVRRSAAWLLGEEIAVPGDWAVRRPGLAPGGWAFEFANDLYPDTDDTAEIVLALRRVAAGLPGRRPAAVRHRGRGQPRRRLDGRHAVRPTAGGARSTPTTPARWPTSCRSATSARSSTRRRPTSPRTWWRCSRSRDAPAIQVTQRGVTWLLRNQETDGSWFGRWGANYVYGTGAAVPALVEAGVDAGAPAIRAAVHWLVAHQNPDGGWGEDLRSYADPENWAGKGASTPSQTAWALLALLAAGETDHPATRAGVDHLISTQRADGGWDEDHFTGTGFPGDFYINYHLYRLVFPITALGRYLDVTP